MNENTITESWAKVHETADRIVYRVADRTTLATGLEAWAGLRLDQTPEGIAARYNVDVDAVHRNKAATEGLHRQLCVLFGNECYFEALDFETAIGLAFANEEHFGLDRAECDNHECAYRGECAI